MTLRRRLGLLVFFGSMIIGLIGAGPPWPMGGAPLPILDGGHAPPTASPSPTPGSPFIIGQIQAWYNVATASAYVTASPGRVSSFTDQSGNGNNLVQATAAAQPSLAPTGVNGSPGIIFNGTSNFLLDSATTLGGGTTYTVVAVVSVPTPSPAATATGIPGTWFSAYSAASPSAGFEVGYIVGTKPSMLRYATWTLTATAAPSFAPVIQIASVAAGSPNNSYAFFSNGTSNGGTTTTNVLATFTQLSMGLDYPTHKFFAGTVGEEIVYSTTLSTSARQVLEGCLAWKWGIQAELPTTHPYYSAPPSNWSLSKC